VAQPKLLDIRPEWQTNWGGMPEFEHGNLLPYQSIQVHFESPEDRERFAKLVGQTITDRTQSIWHPEAEIDRMVTARYHDES